LKRTSFTQVPSRPSREVRSDEIRPQVEDALRARCGGRTDSAAWADAQQWFVKKALRLAKKNGLRPFRNNYQSDVQAALTSLRYLLKEKTTTTKGVVRTGVNEHWVLDMWELALKDSKPLLTEPVKPRRSSATLRETRVFIDEAPAPVTSSSLGSRIYEAFLTQDGPKMVELVRELEATS